MDLVMIGTVVYCNPSRRFALLTPLGQTRDCDVFVHEIQFDVAGIGHACTGQTVEFDVAPDANGKLEAINLRIPNSDLTAGINGGDVEAVSGASPAADAQPAAGTPSVVR